MSKMKQAILIILKNKELNKIRKQYDPHYNTFKSHITIVYPFSRIDQKELSYHINYSIKDIGSFKISLEGFMKFRKSPRYLYLLVKKGKYKIKEIYKKLNQGLLSSFKNKKLPRGYIPHVSLGTFKSEKEIDEAVKQLKKQKIKFDFTIKTIQLLTLNKDHSIKYIKNFKL